MSCDAAPITTVAAARRRRYRPPVASAAFAPSDRRPEEYSRAPVAGRGAIPTNPFPPEPFARAAIGPVVGAGHAEGATGRIPIRTFVRYQRGVSNGYAPAFAVGRTACAIAFVAHHLVSLRLSPLKDPVS